jgi:hypothetical protein
VAALDLDKHSAFPGTGHALVVNGPTSQIISPVHGLEGALADVAVESQDHANGDPERIDPLQLSVLSYH